MTDVERAFVAFEGLLADYPEVGSALLIAVAVEWQILAEDRARLMAEKLDLRDFERIRSVLSAEISENGRRGELVALVRSGVRVRRRAEKLLKRSAGRPNGTT